MLHMGCPRDRVGELVVGTAGALVGDMVVPPGVGIMVVPAGVGAGVT
jgi:hypothetical protein